MLENLLRDFYRCTTASKLFDCAFRVAAPLSGSRSCPVPLKSQLCERLAAKKEATFLAFRSKTDPSSGSQWTRNESPGLLLYSPPSPFLTLSTFFSSQPLSPSLSLSLVVSRLPYCRGREAVPRTIFLRKAIQMPKNAHPREIHAPLVYLRAEDTCVDQNWKVRGRTCFMNHTC